MTLGLLVAGCTAPHRSDTSTTPPAPTDTPVDSGSTSVTEQTAETGCPTAVEPPPPPHQNPLGSSGCADPGAIRYAEPSDDPCAPPVVSYFMACTGTIDGGTYPIYRSSDLVSWEPAGSVFPAGQLPAWIGGQKWAPEIHEVLVYHAYVATDLGGGRKPLLDRIDWSDDDWPVIHDGTPSSEVVDLLAENP